MQSAIYEPYNTVYFFRYFTEVKEVSYIIILNGSAPFTDMHARTISSRLLYNDIYMLYTIVRMIVSNCC